MKSPWSARSSSVRRFLAHLDGLIASLPTTAEKQQIQENLTTLNEFIGFLRKSFTELPSSEEASDIRQIADRLDGLIAKVESHPLLGGALGAPSGAKRRPSAPKQVPEDADRVREIIAELEKLPVEDIRTRLQNETLRTMAELRSVASVMGIRGVAKLGREALAHQITTKIANYRGYIQLRGSAEEPTNQ